MADNTSASGPKSTFEAYRAEGDMLFKQQEYKKALESYDQAMELRADDKNCLVARSRCYLQLGDTDSALKDAEASMHDEPNFFKGLLCKADALYFKGEFEMALVFYHRGNKLRPEQHEFRLGIQKCQEAINNSVGSPEKVKLRKDGDLSYFYKPQEEEAERKKKQSQMRPGRRMNTAQRKPARPVSGNKDKTIKQLLGSLYADREYLEQLLKEEDNRLDELGTCGKCGYKTQLCSCNSLAVIDHDHIKYGEEEDEFKVYSEKFKNKKLVLAPEQQKKKKGSTYDDDDEDDKPQRNGPKRIDAKEKKTKTSQEIHNLALNGLLYLDTRTDFWRQQKPMYARKRDRELQQAKMAKRGNTDPVKFTLMKLREIDDYHTRGKYKDVIKESTRTMKLVNSWTEDELGNKQEVTASLHSSAGNAYLELGDFDNALSEHQQDHDIAKSIQNDELESRALDNLGRVYARVGKFDDAIKIWEKKIERKPDMQDLEAAWVYHELGRCYLETNKTEKAKEYGEKSYERAQAADDEVWQLHSSVLLAQSQAKQGELEAAVDSFERALDFAKLQEDRDAEKAIKKALKDVNERIAKKLSDPDAEEEERREDNDDGAVADDEAGGDYSGAEVKSRQNSGKTQSTSSSPAKALVSPSPDPSGRASSGQKSPDPQYSQRVDRDSPEGQIASPTSSHKSDKQADKVSRGSVGTPTRPTPSPPPSAAGSKTSLQEARVEESDKQSLTSVKNEKSNPTSPKGNRKED